MEVWYGTRNPCQSLSRGFSRYNYWASKSIWSSSNDASTAYIYIYILQGQAVSNLYLAFFTAMKFNEEREFQGRAKVSVIFVLYIYIYIYNMKEQEKTYINLCIYIYVYIYKTKTFFSATVWSLIECCPCVYHSQLLLLEKVKRDDISDEDCLKSTSTCVSQNNLKRRLFMTQP